MNNYTLDLNSGELRHSDEELYHWGILGQKWGVRRYQNKDGTKTPEGEIHYGRLKNKQRKRRLKLEQQAAKDEIKKKKALAKIDKKIASTKRKDKLLKKVEDISTKLASHKVDSKINKENTSDNIKKAKDKNKKKNKKAQNKKDFYSDYGKLNTLLSNGEKRTHDTISTFYKDKYVLDSQTRLKSRKFRKMSTQDLQNYINRYNTETNFMGAYERRSPYDFSSRTLKRLSSNITSAAKIALGVYVVKKILEKNTTGEKT